MSRVIKYGSHTFTYDRLTVRETFVMADDGRTQLGTNYVFNVTGYVYGTSKTDFNTKLAEMRSVLKDPRKTFTVYDGTDVLFNYGEETDEGWGPIPENLNIHDFAGMMASKYEWSVKVFRRECDDVKSTVQKKILSITRQYSFEVDAAGYTTRTVTGTIIVTDKAGSVDRYRSSIAVPLHGGWRREKSSYSTSKDQRTLSFSIIDREVFVTLPNGVGKGEASWTVRLADMGARVFYNLSGRFDGSKDTKPGDLLGRILDLVKAKFPMSDPSLVFEDVQMASGVYENSISFGITASGVVGKNPTTSKTDLKSVFESITRPLTSSNRSYLPSWYGGVPSPGSWSPELAVFDACSPSNSIPTSSPGTSATPVNQGSKANQGSGGSGVPQNGMSPENLRTPYVAFHERISYEYDNHVVQIPSKTESIPAFTQKLNPTTTIIVQSGYFSVYSASASSVPYPPVPVGYGQVMSSSVMPLNPEPIGDGSVNMYTVHWRYVIAGDKNVGDKTPAGDIIQLPVDPRRRKYAVEKPYSGRGLGIS